MALEIILTIPSINDILVSSVKEADFLSEKHPVSMREKTTVFLTGRRMRGFLLEDEMPKGIKGFQKGHKLFKGSEKGWFKKGHKVIGGFKKGHISEVPFKKGHKINLGRKRSEETKKKIGLAILGKNHWNWKGGIKKSAGRIFILRPKHPFCDCRGYILRSRLVMEKKLGRFLTPKEVVHHINGVIDDDRPENLKLFKSNSKHAKFHGRIKNKKK